MICLRKRPLIHICNVLNDLQPIFRKQARSFTMRMITSEIKPYEYALLSRKVDK